MSYSFWQDQSSSSDSKNCDIVVVGAGISGLSTCYWLQKEDPGLSVTLIDKSDVAAGATGRNAGFITCGSVEHFSRLVERWGADQAKEIWSFSEDNLDQLKDEIFAKSADPVSEFGFEAKGSFSLASTESEFKELQDSARLMDSLKIKVENLSEADIRKRLNVHGFVGGIKYLDDASVDPIKLCQWLRRNFKGHYLPQTEFYKLEPSGGDRKVFTNRGEITCSAVVFAGNGYLPTMDPYFSDKVYPTRGQILAVEPVDLFLEGPCYANFVLDYFRQLPTGQVLIGGFRQLEKTTEVGYSDHTTDVIQTALYDFIQKHLPTLQGKKVTHSWAGVMGFSADGQPFVGAKPDDPQVYFLGGFTAHGLGLAFNSAQALVSQMYGQDLPDFLSARRF